LKLRAGLDPAQFGPPEIMNTDQDSQFTSWAWTDRLRQAGVKISIDGKGRFLDNIFVERLWRSLKYECVYLYAWSGGREARAGIGRWIEFYNRASQHPSVYVVEENRLCWSGSDAAGCFGLCRARTARLRAAGPSRSSRLAGC